MKTYYVAQWRNSDDVWCESLGTAKSGGQQAFHADELGIADPLSEEAARAFAEILTIGPYAGRVRIVKRTEEVIEEA